MINIMKTKKNAVGMHLKVNFDLATFNYYSLILVFNKYLIHAIFTTANSDRKIVGNSLSF